ncbi:hypothetical protein [Micromonospora sp. KC723]|uniref:hypothetical protein n=1 Tax=Micromonospora sp. KC723 TaxID=2530381 RepID=UPI001047F043|nr:hypothetical protein [Micromonospora sp. KC723]TDB78331.1 hypothetical protein E1165_01340 [Micromonospora sp. KC723]
MLVTVGSIAQRQPPWRKVGRATVGRTATVGSVTCGSEECRDGRRRGSTSFAVALGKSGPPTSTHPELERSTRYIDASKWTVSLVGLEIKVGCSMLVDARIEVGGQNGDEHSIACSDAGVTEQGGFCGLVGSVARIGFVWPPCNLSRYSSVLVA